MSPASIGPVKAMLCDLDLTDLAPKLAERLECKQSPEDIRSFLANYASEHNIPV